VTSSRNNPSTRPATDRGGLPNQQADTRGGLPDWPTAQQEPDRAGRQPSCLGDLNALPPTLAVEAAGHILGCGRSLAYDLVRRGEFPCRVLRVGRLYRIPTADLLDVLGVHPAGPAGSRLNTIDHPSHATSVHAGQAAGGATAAAR
jgi:predicted DNA-binding transcriptional regulator AlpA